MRSRMRASAEWPVVSLGQAGGVKGAHARQAKGMCAVHQCKHLPQRSHQVRPLRVRHSTYSRADGNGGALQGAQRRVALIQACCGGLRHVWEAAAGSRHIRGGGICSGERQAQAWATGAAEKGCASARHRLGKVALLSEMMSRRVDNTSRYRGGSRHTRNHCGTSVGAGQKRAETQSTARPVTHQRYYNHRPRAQPSGPCDARAA